MESLITAVANLDKGEPPILAKFNVRVTLINALCAPARFQNLTLSLSLHGSYRLISMTSP